jgi:serine O-acetyltransferase
LAVASRKALQQDLNPMTVDWQLKQQLPALTDKIVESYHSIGTINHLGHSRLPSTDAVISIAGDLKDIIFPGYRRRQNLHVGNVVYHIGDLIDGLHDRLTAQIARALRHEQHPELRIADGSIQDGTCDFDVQAQEITIRFLESIPSLRELLASDVHAAYEGDPAANGLDEIIFCYPGLEAVTIHRIAHQLFRLGVPFIPRILSEWSHMQTGIDIHPGATIGPSFFIDHGTGVVVGETCCIGSNVTLYQGVTLGAWTFPRDEQGNLIRNQKRHPTIEDNVAIYSSATVLGGDTIIGRNSRIGAGVSINRSVPPNTLVTNEKPSLRFREAG